MKDENKTKEQLINELVKLRQHITKLETLEANHKRAEDRLRQAEEKYRNLTESLSELVYCADPQTFEATYVNSAIEKFYGYTVKQWLEDPKLWENTIHPHDKKRVFAEFTDARLKMQNSIIEYRIVRKDKTIRWVEDHVSWEKDRRGQIFSMNGVMYDITERKQVENLLRQSEEKTRALLNATTDSAILIDPKGKIIAINEAPTHRLGKRADELVGMCVFDFFPPKVAKFRKARADEAIRLRKPIRFEDDSLAKVFDTCVYPIFDTQGKVVQLAVFAHDITERKQAEEELKKKSEELQYLSRQIIKVQEQERKRISQELHDEIGQSLTAVGFNLEAIKNILPGDSGLLRKNLAETKSLINEISDSVSAISSDLRPALLDDLGLVSALNWYTRRFSKVANIDINLQTARTVERLPAESKTVLYRAVQETLTNVLKHSKASRVKIQLKSKDKFVELRIEDNGIGFDVKGVVDTANRTPGLGLLGMRERIKLVGGTVDITASPGKGTKLFIRVPC